MFNLGNNNQWENIIQGWNTVDPVLGGVSGDSNDPLQKLTNRTSYLYDRLGRFENVPVINAVTTIDNTYVNRLIYVIAAGNLTLTIDDVAHFKIGAILHFKCKCPQNKVISFQTTSNQLIEDGNKTSSIMWACDGDEFKLVCIGGSWIFMEPRGNFDKVGKDDLVRIQPRNSIIADGCRPEFGNPLLLRADFARYWNAVKDIAVDDITWLSDPLTYRAFPSMGNGVTTFRPPDMRGMTWRGIDNGRGIRLGGNNTPGSYENDTVKVANGVMGVKVTGVNTVTSLDSNNPSGQEFDLAHVYDPSTGTETKGKNIGLIPIVYY